MKKASLYLIVILFILVGCTENIELDSIDYPIIELFPPTDVNESGATFHAKIIRRGRLDIVGYGFTWDAQSGYYILERNIVPSERIMERIESNLYPNLNVKLRFFIKTVDTKVYSEPVFFISKGVPEPIIDSILPKKLIEFSYIKIYGKHLSHDLLVEIGGVPTLCTRRYSDSISLKVPKAKISEISFDEVAVDVDLYSKNGDVSFKDAIVFLPPKIDKIEPISGKPGTDLFLYGRNFSYDYDDVIIYFNDIPCTPLYGSPNRVRVKVPDIPSGDYSISFFYNNRVNQAIEKFTIVK